MFPSAFVDRTVQHSAWPIVRIDLPQVMSLGAAPLMPQKEVYDPLFCPSRELNPGLRRDSYLSGVLSPPP